MNKKNQSGRPAGIKFPAAFLLLAAIAVSPVSGEKIGNLRELNLPSYMAVKGNECYILDEPEVKVYSLKTDKLLRRFGKQGSGPGELVPNDEIPLQMQLTDTGVFLNSQRKFILFSPNGTVLKEKSIPFMCMQIIPVEKNYVVSRVNFTTEMEIFFEVFLYNENFEKIKKIYSSPPSPTIRSRGKVILPANFTYIATEPGGKRLYCYSGRQKDFKIHVFGLDGHELKPIEMNWKPVKWEKQSQQEVIEWFKTCPRFRRFGDAVKNMIEFPAYLPAIRNIAVENNLLYVQTYQKNEKNSVFFVFDENAKRRKKICLPDESRYIVKINPDVTFTFNNGFYYYLLEDMDREQWELHRVPVTQ